MIISADVVNIHETSACVIMIYVDDDGCYMNYLYIKVLEKQKIRNEKQHVVNELHLWPFLWLKWMEV